MSLLTGGTAVARERLPREAASVGEARLLVEDVLVEHGVTDRSLLDAAVLCVSELATDCVRHGTGADIAVEVGLGPRRVQVTVTVAAEDDQLDPGSGASAGGPPDVVEHSRQVLDMVAGSWDLRVYDGVRTLWYRLER